MNHPDVLTSSSLSSSSTSSSISSSSSSFVTSGFVEPVDPSHDVILLPRSVHQRLLQELCAGNAKLRAMDNLQRLLREKVDELERTRERLENCQSALLRCERRLCDVIAQQTISFRSSSVSNISNIISSPCGRQDHAECGVECKRSDTGEGEDGAKGTDASTNTETEITSLEKPGFTYPYLGLASDQFPEMVVGGLAADVNKDVSVQLRKMPKVVNEDAPASVSIAGFSAAPAKSESRGVEYESLESSGANQTSLPHPGLGQWHWQPSATPNLEKSSSKTTNLAGQRVSVAFSKDLISKLIQQNVRLKTTMKQLLGYKGLTITQYLDTQEQLDIIEQLRQEIRLARIRIQQLEGREKTLRLNPR